MSKNLPAAAAVSASRACTHWNGAQDSYRTSVLNALVWIAGAEVPEGGVPSKTPTLEELEADLGMPRPADFNAEAMREKIKTMNP